MKKKEVGMASLGGTRHHIRLEAALDSCTWAGRGKAVP
jgi:hypothetical protein